MEEGKEGEVARIRKCSREKGKREEEEKRERKPGGRKKNRRREG